MATIPFPVRSTLHTLRERRPDLSGFADALESEFQKFHVAVSAIDAAPELTAAGKAARRQTEAAGFRDSIKQHIEAVDRADRVLESDLNTALAKFKPAAPSDTLTELQAQEIRSRFRSMDEAARQRRILQAVVDRDEKVLAAIEYDPMGAELISEALSEKIQDVRHVLATAAVPDFEKRRQGVVLQRMAIENALRSAGATMDTDAA